jgi:hypothetical protein
MCNHIGGVEHPYRRIVRVTSLHYFCWKYFLNYYLPYEYTTELECLYQLHLSGEIFDISPCPDVVVRVGIVPIRSIRNSVEIVAPNMELGNGAYVHKLSKKCVQVKKLTSVAAVSTKENAVRRMLEEVFQCEKETYIAQIAYVG